MLKRRSIFVLVLALMLVPGFILAAKKDPAPTPANASRFTPHDKLLAGQPTLMSRTPGPLMSPGSPIEERTTIVPFPIPGDTSRSAIERSKTMNAPPRVGVTMLAPQANGVRVKYDGHGRWQAERFSDPSTGRFVTADPIVGFRDSLVVPVPVYPWAVRDSSLAGTVIVMAHVMPDGTVGETRVSQSIRALDQAAVQMVKLLRFRPASQAEAPLVWLVIPVTFTLH